MSSLPQLYPRLSLHLTDRAHTPFISSPLSRRPASTPEHSNARAGASRQSQLETLHSLTTTALASHDAAARLGLGLPSRIMVEHGAGGPVVLTSYVRARRKHDVPGTGVVVSEGVPMPVPVPGIRMGETGGTYSMGAGTGVGTAVQVGAGALGTRTTATTTSIEPRNPSPNPSPNPSVRSPDATESGPLSPLPPLPSTDQPLAASSADPQMHTSLDPSLNSGPNPSHSSTNGKPPSSFTFLASRAPASVPVPLSQQPAPAFSPPSSSLPVDQDEDEDTPRAPTLLSLVVSPSPEDLPDARRAAARLERIGRELQVALAAEGGDDHMVAPAPPGTEVGGDSAPESVPGTLGATSGEVTGDEED